LPRLVLLVSQSSATTKSAAVRMTLTVADLSEAGGRSEPGVRCDAGHRPERFIGASSVCVIRKRLTSSVRACHDGGQLKCRYSRRKPAGHERRSMSRRA